MVFAARKENSMTLFECLVLAHLIGDWLLQTEHEAMNKAKGHFCNFAILKHCASYTLTFVPFFFTFGLSLVWLVPVFVSHWFLDRRWPVITFIHVAKRTSRETINNLFWLVIAVDQVLHILVIASIVLLQSI